MEFVGVGVGGGCGLSIDSRILSIFASDSGRGRRKVMDVECGSGGGVLVNTDGGLGRVVNAGRGLRRAQDVKGDIVPSLSLSDRFKSELVKALGGRPKKES